jgi:glutathione reductase (NADPH)
VRRFDLIVIGTGSAGTSIATTCRAAGWSVGIVDELPFGGTCVLRGCDPKKVLVGAGELVDWSRRMNAKGVVTKPLQIDWPALMRFKRTFTEPAPAQRQRSYDEAGIVSFHGRARFVDRSQLRIDGEIVEAKHFAIASGAKPVPLEIPGEEHVITSTQFLELDRLPSSIVFIGGGYISMEFAHVAARAGVKAFVLDRGDRPLKGFDADLVARLIELTRAAGIDVSVKTAVLGVERRNGEFVVRARQGDKEATFPAALVIHGGGRVPDIDELDLQAAGVARTEKGIQVNAFLQSTSNPAVYAAGDAADGGGLPLTPVAGTEGETVAQNLLRGNHRTLDFSGLTSIVYTIPALASVGLGEVQAKERGISYRCSTGDSSEWYTYRRVNAASQYKIVLEAAGGTILGAHFLGPFAEELANLFALAIRAKISKNVMNETLFGYPTAASDIEYLLADGPPAS